MTNHTSMSKFPSENDRSYRVVVDAIKGFLDFAPTRQLWKAVGMGRIRGVQMMLDLGADPNLQDIEGESALHKAVRCKGNSVRVIETLLSRGADIDLKDIEQKTALSIAESESKDDIARFLRRNGATREFWDMKKIGNEHPLDKIYMDGPSHSSNIERRWDLEVLDSNCEDACRKSTLSITHFSQCASGTLDRYRSKTSVFDALYDKDSSKEIIGNALTKYQEVNNMETKSASFTWYHLPANNVSQSILN
jgi:ankyrin repeat protein